MIIKIPTRRIKKSNRLKIKRTQKIYAISGLSISIFASVALYLNAEKANFRQEVWFTTKNIAAGELISQQNIKLVRADLGLASANYLSGETSVFGSTALVPISFGNFLNSESIGKISNLRNVSLRISNGHLPPFLKQNNFVDIWFSDPVTLNSTLLIPKVPVVWVDEVNTNYGGVTTVVVSVPESNVLQLVNAARTDGIDLVQREN